MTAATPNKENEELRREIVDILRQPHNKRGHYTSIAETIRVEKANRILKRIEERDASRDQQIALAAEIKGMEKAKARVLRRTEIPADAKKPTRDIVVIVGEECARIIGDDIATLKQTQGGEEL